MNSAAKTGAFFDLDGTLLPGPSLEWRFVSFLIACDSLDGAAGVRWLAHFARNVFGDPLAAIEGNKTHFAGLHQSLAEDWEESLITRPIPFFARAMERIAWHATQGHLIFLVSGAIEPLARAVARRIPACVDIRASELEVWDGRWTGQLAGEHMSGEAKERAIRQLALRHALELGESYAYGNRATDVPMLRPVGNPVAVNPDPALRCVARRCGWQICKWEEPLAIAPGVRAQKFSAGAAR
jgi:HAD superfamily hydrolase (TIGR01490 family)